MDTPEYDKELGRLFRQLPVEKPSDGFSLRVMEQVLIEARLAARRKRIQRIAWYIAVPCSVFILLLSGYLIAGYLDINLLKYFEPLLVSFRDFGLSVSFLFPKDQMGKLFLFGIMFLTLLLADLFIRRHAERKKGMEN